MVEGLEQRGLLFDAQQDRSVRGEQRAHRLVELVAGVDSDPERAARLGLTRPVREHRIRW
ncbi:MAG: hypothetical protein M3300_04140 [Actinomycetota bacterium]|nr:hypothetical protein [Actinomycetota bacterium]